MVGSDCVGGFGGCDVENEIKNFRVQIYMENENTPNDLENSQKENSLTEKLRDELFDYRVDIKTYKRNLSTIIIAGSVLISILAFFGYSRIENIETTIMEQANARLAITDALLSKIDQTKIDSLNQLLVSREQEFLYTIYNFERIIQQSNDLQMLILQGLPANSRIEERRVERFIREFPTNIFTLHPFNTELSRSQIEFIFLSIDDSVEISDDDFLAVRLFPRGRRVILLENHYAVNSRFNKLSFGINPFQDYVEYDLEIALFRRGRNNAFTKHYVVKNIRLK